MSLMKEMLRMEKWDFFFLGGGVCVWLHRVYLCFSFRGCWSPIATNYPGIDLRRTAEGIQQDFFCFLKSAWGWSLLESNLRVMKGRKLQSRLIFPCTDFDGEYFCFWSCTLQTTKIPRWIKEHAKYTICNTYFQVFKLKRGVFEYFLQ